MFGPLTITIKEIIWGMKSSMSCWIFALCSISWRQGVKQLYIVCLQGDTSANDGQYNKQMVVCFHKEIFLKVHIPRLLFWKESDKYCRKTWTKLIHVSVIQSSKMYCVYLMQVCCEDTQCWDFFLLLLCTCVLFEILDILSTEAPLGEVQKYYITKPLSDTFAPLYFKW